MCLNYRFLFIQDDDNIISNYSTSLHFLVFIKFITVKETTLNSALAVSVKGSRCYQYSVFIINSKCNKKALYVLIIFLVVFFTYISVYILFQNNLSVRESVEGKTLFFILMKISEDLRWSAGKSVQRAHCLFLFLTSELSFSVFCLLLLCR